MRRFACVSVVTSLLVLVACGDGALGDACDTEGKVDGECDDGLVCGKREASGALVCLKQCVDSKECASDEACSGLSGSLKACRRK